MRILGSRVRHRRRLMGLNQSEVTTTNTASLISKVENGRTLPSLSNLTEIATSLETTTCDLIGEHLILEAVKLTILNPAKCQDYLALLPPTTTTRYLTTLAKSVDTKTPVPNPPPDPELHYLAVQVCMSRDEFHEALSIANKGLSIGNELWRFYLLLQQYHIWGILNNSSEQAKVKVKLLDARQALTTSPIWLLSDAENITSSEIKQYRLAALLSQIQIICPHW